MSSIDQRVKGVFTTDKQKTLVKEILADVHELKTKTNDTGLVQIEEKMKNIVDMINKHGKVLQDLLEAKGVEVEQDATMEDRVSKIEKELSQRFPKRDIEMGLSPVSEEPAKEAAAEGAPSTDAAKPQKKKKNPPKKTEVVDKKEDIFT